MKKESRGLLRHACKTSVALQGALLWVLHLVDRCAVALSWDVAVSLQDVVASLQDVAASLEDVVALLQDAVGLPSEGHHNFAKQEGVTKKSTQLAVVQMRVPGQLLSWWSEGKTGKVTAGTLVSFVVGLTGGKD